MLLRLVLRSRDELLSSGGGGGEGSSVVDLQAELRQQLLDCLRISPTVNLRQNEGLQESLEELLRECKADSKYEAAAGVQRVLELFKQTGVASEGEAFLRTTADEISKRARRRVQLVKERQDLQKIMEFVQTHKQELKRKHAAYGEYLEAVRESRITVKNVYANEREQRKDAKKKAKGADALAKKEEEEAKKAAGERVSNVIGDNPTFARIVEEDPALAKYIEAHPNLTKTQFRDLLDRRPDFVKAFDKHPEELMKAGRAPALSLMLNQHKELKAALDKKQEVREILESRPDLTRNDLNELVHTNAQLKDLYDSRPELKELLQQRAKLFEEEQVLMCSSGAAKQRTQPSQQQRSKGLFFSHPSLPLSPLHPSTLTEISRGSEAGRLHRRPYGPRLREASPQGGCPYHNLAAAKNGLVVILRLLVCALGCVQRASSQQPPHHHHYLPFSPSLHPSSPPHTTQAPIPSSACTYPRRSSARARAGASSSLSSSSRSCLICSIGGSLCSIRAS